MELVCCHSKCYMCCVKIRGQAARRRAGRAAWSILRTLDMAIARVALPVAAWTRSTTGYPRPRGRRAAIVRVRLAHRAQSGRRRRHRATSEFARARCSRSRRSPASPRLPRTSSSSRRSRARTIRQPPGHVVCAACAAAVRRSRATRAACAGGARRCDRRPCSRARLNAAQARRDRRDRARPAARSRRCCCTA